MYMLLSVSQFIHSLGSLVGEGKSGVSLVAVALALVVLAAVDPLVDEDTVEVSEAESVWRAASRGAPPAERRAICASESRGKARTRGSGISSSKLSRFRLWVSEAQGLGRAPAAGGGAGKQDTHEGGKRVRRGRRRKGGAGEERGQRKGRKDVEQALSSLENIRPPPSAAAAVTL